VDWEELSLPHLDGLRPDGIQLIYHNEVSCSSEADGKLDPQLRRELERKILS